MLRDVWWAYSGKTLQSSFRTTSSNVFPSPQKNRKLFGHQPNAPLRYCGGRKLDTDVHTWTLTFVQEHHDCTPPVFQDSFTFPALDMRATSIYLGKIVSFQAELEKEVARCTENDERLVNETSNEKLTTIATEEGSCGCVHSLTITYEKTWSSTNRQKYALGICQEAVESTILGVTV